MSEPQGLSEQQREELIAYLDGELDPEAAQAIEQKLQQDPVWRREAEMLQKAWDLLDYLPASQATASFTEQTLTALAAARSSQHRRQRWWRWAKVSAWVAAVMLAALVGYRIGRVPSPSAEADAPWPPPEEVLLLLEHRHYWRYYEQVGSFSFLRQLDQAGIFEEGS